MTVSDLAVSIIRTVVPAAVAFAAAQLLRVGVELDTVTAATVVTTVLTGVYYATVRQLEARWPKAGWLLGYPLAPTYQRPTDDA